MTPAISIVVTNWNGSKVLGNCLRSIFEKTKDVSFEIIVVDDASADDSVHIMRTQFPHVRLIVNPRSLRFSEANNVGIRASKGRYVVLLNNDTLLVNDAFSALVKYMDHHPDVGVTGGMLLGLDGLPHLSYGDFPSITEAAQGALFLDKLFPSARWVKRMAWIPPADAQIPYNVEFICGADMVIRREVLDEVGLLDSQFRAYCEETDYCYRILQLRKWRIVFVPEAKITHLYGSTWGPASQRKYKLLYSSLAKFLRKHHSFPYALTVRALYAFRYALKCCADWLRSLPGMPKSDAFKQQRKESIWNFAYSLFPPKVSE